MTVVTPYHIILSLLSLKEKERNRRIEIKNKKDIDKWREAKLNFLKFYCLWIWQLALPY